MKEPVWVERSVALALHDRLLAEHGGASGVRDEGLLESALARPRQIHTYEKADVPRLAAAYAAGIVRKHPFVDGNKRVGFMAAYIFLRRNGLKLVASELKAAKAMLQLAAGVMDEAAFAEWLRANVNPSK